MFKKPFSFNGRIRRLEFGLSYLVYIGVIFLISIVSDIFEFGGIIGLAVIPLFWFFLAQAIKRCHDRGNTGWFVLIPFYGLWLLFADSDYGDIEYGPNPKGLGNHDDIDEIGEHLEP